VVVGGYHHVRRLVLSLTRKPAAKLQEKHCLPHGHVDLSIVLSTQRSIEHLCNIGLDCSPSRIGCCRLRRLEQFDLAQDSLAEVLSNLGSRFAVVFVDKSASRFAFATWAAGKHGAGVIQEINLEDLGDTEVECLCSRRHGVS
jgi:hypothetical protein